MAAAAAATATTKTSFPFILVVHSKAPEDAPEPEIDLNIWEPDVSTEPPTLSAFKTWWDARRNPLWVGVDASAFTAKTFEAFYKNMGAPTPICFVLRIVLYTSYELRARHRPAHHPETAPCGCHGCCGVCDYHRYGGHGEDSVGDCGCSRVFGVTCAYHAEV
jgi:hypothetical protein